MSLRTCSALCLSALLLLPPPGWSQQAAAPKTNLVESQGGTLKIVVVQGEGAQNNIKARTATQPVVEVRDQQDKPVAGAEVVFQLPAAGPSGVFNGWMRNQTARTDAQGQASAQGFVPNDQPGRFNIKITATQGTRSASVVVAQSNVAGQNGKQASGSRKVLWTVVAIAAAGAIGGGIAASRGDDTPAAASTTPISITPGAVTVAGPR